MSLSNDTKHWDPAFPLVVGDDYVEVRQGLSRRDYIATQMMQSLMIADCLDFDSMANYAIRSADALIKAMADD